jgi:molybdate transport system substrate-binding protein
MRAVLLLLLLVLSVPGAFAAHLKVFAAASLSDALNEIAAHYEPASGDKLVFNLAASSVLARQIKEGAPADIFFSADEAKMDDLARDGLIVVANRRSLLANRLVLIVAVDRAATISHPHDLMDSKVTRLALAEPATVPAGIYAKEYLRRAGLWETVAPKIVPTENVRACLAVVEAGNVDAGIVYRTDARSSKRVRIVYEVPEAAGPRISYPLAIVKGSKQAAATAKFAAYLASAAARTIFEKHGFIVLP